MSDERLEILGLHISNITFNTAIDKVKNLAINHQPSYVCFANVHMTIEAHKNKFFASKVNNATLTLADGVPLTKASYVLKNKNLERIAGMDFMPAILSSMNNDRQNKFKVFFYGSTDDVLQQLVFHTNKNYPNVEVAGHFSPPFRTITKDETLVYINKINNSGAHVVFVGLGCPKQENWMAENFKKIHAVLLGVGGAFLTTTGLQKRAPLMMQKTGFEWMFRLSQEPKRLFKRYFITNSIFIGLFLKATALKIFNGKR